MHAPSPAAVLHQTFGFNAFRGAQEAIIHHVCDGGDALVLMPTGGGKSLCYQVPALIRTGVAIVVSPLIALMHNQVQALLELGVRAAYLNSSLTSAEASQVQNQLQRGEYDLLYVAPERLLMPHFLDQLDKVVEHGEGVALFAIDEAHCVSQWGHDFRPEYIQLSTLHERFPHVPRIALTATADAITRAEIVSRLKLEEAQIFVSSFDRPNIRYHIVEKDQPRQQLLDFIQSEHPHDSGIVYCLSRKKVDETAEWLQSEGLNALPYHAGMSADMRRRHQETFLREELDEANPTLVKSTIMVATIAFGMGIDKPNVRFVAHLDLPKSVEGYYQETGRAGRDGAPATAWMSYGLGDAIQLRRFINESDSRAEYKKLSHEKLDALIALCESVQCRRHALLEYFGETMLSRPRQSQPPAATANHAPYCGYCDNCLSPPALMDATIAAQKALSCVFRSGQRFGMKHLIDVLLGKSNEKISQWRHNELSTYGIGQEYSASQWRSLFHHLIAEGYLLVDSEQYSSLMLTPAARAVLKGEQSIHIRLKPPKASKADKKAKSAKSAPRTTHLDHAAERRLAALKAWRMHTAKTQNLPAYVIFHDSTLEEIAHHAPQTLAALETINGLGAKKLERYGAAILEICQR